MNEWMYLALCGSRDILNKEILLERSIMLKMDTYKPLHLHFRGLLKSLVVNFFNVSRSLRKSFYLKQLVPTCTPHNALENARSKKNPNMYNEKMPSLKYFIWLLMRKISRNFISKWTYWPEILLQKWPLEAPKWVKDPIIGVQSIQAVGGTNWGPFQGFLTHFGPLEGSEGSGHQIAMLFSCFLWI